MLAAVAAATARLVVYVNASSKNQELDTFYNGVKFFDRR